MATSATTTDWLYKKYMYYILRGKAWTPTPQVKIALYTTTPGSGIGDTGVEVIENDNTKYKRVTLPANDQTSIEARAKSLMDEERAKKENEKNN